MGCGASKGGGEKGSGKAAAGKDGGPGGRRKSVLKEVVDIKAVSGEAVTLTNFPRVIFIFGMHCMFSANTFKLNSQLVHFKFVTCYEKRSEII